MTNVLEIEKAIKRLPRDEYGQLRQWIEDYEIENDLASSSAHIADILDKEDGGENQLIDE